MISTLCKGAVLGVGTLCLIACGSNARKIHYYTLTPDVSMDVSISAPAPQDMQRIGVGPVTLPEFQNRDGVLLLTEGQEIVFSEEHLWAGDLKVAIGRSIAAGLGQSLQNQNVIHFPWDSRMRPQQQIFIHVEQLAGPLNGDVILVANWHLFDLTSKKVIFSDAFRGQLQGRSRGMGDYVADLNRLVNQMTNAIAAKLQTIPELP